jgi:uncharacterized protein
MENTAEYWIEQLNLQKHPEGGWYKEIYRSEEKVKTPLGERNAATAIYYLLSGDDFSAFHRINSDEIWHYYAGTSALEILWLQNGKLRTAKLGRKIEQGQQLQIVVPGKCWFAARLVNEAAFALAGCTVAPGFSFNDFELADTGLLVHFPGYSAQIKALIR